MDYAIQTFSLSKNFNDRWGRARVNAVDNLSLQIKYNEVFGLLGPNGSGKTTTIKMLLGLLHPTSGKTAVLGGDSSDPRISSRIGFMPEESYLYKYLSARETLDFYGRLFKLPANIRKSRIDALLEMVGLQAVANRAIGTFSKGMARRIGLAQALINDPDVLILDEPTTGLDPIGTRQIKDLVLQLAKRGKTILLCSHLLADVEDVCDRIAILYGGRIQSQGMVRDLLQQNNKKQITTANISAEALEKIQQILENEHSEFEITCPMDKLESFFIRQVEDAQKQQLQTSGAVSTTQIGNFLSDQHETTENILDSLVTSDSGAKPVPASSDVQTTTIKKTPSSVPNNDLLGELTHPAVTQQPTPVSKSDTLPVEPDKTLEVKKDVLDQLTGGAGITPVDTNQVDQQNNDQQSSKNQGDNSNA